MRQKDTAQVAWNSMKPIFFIMCLLGNTVAKPARTKPVPEKPAGQFQFFPQFGQDQIPYQLPIEISQQFFNFDPMSAFYESIPFIFNTPQLQFLPPDRQTQIMPSLNFMPLPSMIPQQYGVTGQTFLPTTQMGPLAETDLQTQLMTIIIQPAQGGGSSSEEGAQPTIIINGMAPMIPGGPNMGIKNEEEEPTEEAPLPEGIQPNPEVPVSEIPGPAHQGNALPTEAPVSHTESVFVNGPEDETPIGVQQEVQQTTERTSAANAASTAKVKMGSPCDRQDTAFGGQRMPPTMAPPVPSDVTTHFPLPFAGRRGRGRKRLNQRQRNNARDNQDRAASIPINM